LNFKIYIKTFSENPDQNELIRVGILIFYNFILIENKNAASLQKLQKEFISLFYPYGKLEKTYVSLFKDASSSKWRNPFSYRS